MKLREFTVKDFAVHEQVEVGTVRSWLRKGAI